MLVLLLTPIFGKSQFLLPSFERRSMLLVSSYNILENLDILDKTKPCMALPLGGNINFNSQ